MLEILEIKMHFYIKFVVLMFPALIAGADVGNIPGAKIVIDPLHEYGAVNRKVLGQNIEAGQSLGIMEGHKKDDPRLLDMGRGFWDADKSSPISKIVDLSKQAGMELLRYPGGCLAHNYDWRKSVGHPKDRPDWKFGLDEFLELCRQIGAEPVITASDYILSAKEMPTHLAELVEYLNSPATPDHPWAMKRMEYGHPEPYGIKYFELGNESDHGNHDVKPFRRYTPEEYAAYAIASAQAMRAVDPSIRIGIVTVPSHEHVEGDWNRKVLRLAGGVADFVVVHFYIPAHNFHRSPMSEDLLVQACMAASEQVEFYMKEYQKVIREECGKDLPIAVTEYNALFLGDGPKPYRLSYASALAAADMLRVFLQPEMRVEMVNYWQFLNGYWGMMKSDMDKTDGGMIVERPAYALFKLWSDALQDVVVKTRIESPSASFAGGLKVWPARESTLQPSVSLAEVPTAGIVNFSSLKKIGGIGEEVSAGVYKLSLKDYTADNYVTLATIPWPGPGESGVWKLSYDARFLPDPGAQPVQFALGFTDSRGWGTTFSSGQVGEISSSEWISVQGTFQSLPDSPGVHLWVRLQMKNAIPISGSLEIRNLRIEALSAPVFPEYALLTALTSKSADSKKISLVVFNKSNTDAIPAAITLAGVRPISAKFNEVNGAGLSELGWVRRVIKDEELSYSADGLTHTFPAHSMTAIEFLLP
ncbi:MAG: alpha-L-arabinofuranosidase C-terminal domain-containing protein [Opitutaceae bacterium]